MNNSLYRAAILDLDGVITKTARLHARAWQQMFDDFLQQRSAQSTLPRASQQQGENYAPFDILGDYRKYIDGKPRYDGVRSFLKSRGIELSEGKPEDLPGIETICSLGNRKNQLFLELLKQQGVETYPDTVAQIRKWRERGVKTAVISSSRNCAPILEAAGLSALFDAKVDGVDSARLDLIGKPAPDIFLQAARQLGVEPQQAIVIEDALAGVEAGRAGRFGLVVGVDRDRNGESLRSHGADIVVRDLRELEDITSLPSALEHFNEIASQIRDCHLVLFLDYDGTLTPIVRRPEEAILSDEMRSLLKQLADRATVAAISGRDLTDVRKMVGLSNIHYAGSHGFDIETASKARMQLEAAKSCLPDLDEVEAQLRKQLESMAGSRLERKRFAITVHYREVAESAIDTIEQAVDRSIEKYPRLRKRNGKKIFELQPDIEWDKGRAVDWLLEQPELERQNAFPIYIGDDTTDEDAFRALGDRGIGIRVGNRDEPTRANYFLQNQDEVGQFFEMLLQLLAGRIDN